MPPYRRAIFWFRNDLRLHDHELLALAAEFDLLLPVYCLDPRQFIQHSLGFKRTGSFRALFLLETLADLRRCLEARGSGLYVTIAEPEAAIPRLAHAIDADVVLMEKEITAEEVGVEQRLANALSVPLESYWGRTLIHPDDLPFDLGQAPEVFTSFRKAVEAAMGVRLPVSTPDSLPAFPDAIETKPIPRLADLGLTDPIDDPRAVMRFDGGETAGLARLDEYCWRRRDLARYKDTRNGLLGQDYSSKFSPWLAWGALSPRRIYQEVRRFEQQVLANESTYWLIFELLWRDYFRFMAAKHGNRIFKPGGIKAKPPRFDNDVERFTRWCQGRTGEPFVDANMRELACSGYMSNRGRQNVASFFCHELKLDWRWGAAWFESLLVDYDVCSNQGNWMYLAGVGNDPRPSRRFNIRAQASRYDPDGAYVTHWLGEN